MHVAAAARDEAIRVKAFIRMGRDPGIHARVECSDVFCKMELVERIRYADVSGRWSTGRLSAPAGRANRSPGVPVGPGGEPEPGSKKAELTRTEATARD